jgi:hypothetical protein
MISGIVLGILARLVLTVLGGSRLEGFLTAYIVMSGMSAEMICGFFLSFIGTRSLSVPADVFIAANSRRDPYLHSMKSWAVAEGIGHVLVKQIALSQTVMGGAVLLTCGLLVSIFNSDDGMFTIVFSPIAIVVLQSLFIFTKVEDKGKKWALLYGVGMALYGLIAWAFIDSANGYGMLIALNLLFLSPSDIWPKGKIPAQATATLAGIKRLPWGSYGISGGGLVAGYLSGLFIGCPTSLASECLLNKYSSMQERMSIHTTAGAVAEMVQLMLWLYFGYSRSSYADALGKASIELDPSSIMAFCLFIIVLSFCCLPLVELFSYLYMSQIRLWGKLVNALVMIATIGICIAMTDVVSIVMGIALVMLIGLAKKKYDIPEESKLGVLGLLPLVSINWLAFF